MVIKDFVLPIVLALGITGAVQYFFVGSFSQINNKDQQIEQSFVAPKTTLVQKPLNTEISFVSGKQKSNKIVQSQIQTLWADLLFSTEGASLESLDYKRIIDGKERAIRTIFPVTEFEKEKRCFIVALQDETPFHYVLIDHVEQGLIHKLVYEATGSQCVIRKTFTIKHDQPVIELTLELIPLNREKNLIEPRLFFSAPFLSSLIDTDIISTVVIDNKGSFEKKTTASALEERGWLLPAIFGIDDRYFIHSMIQDPQSFAQRAYYKFDGIKEIFAILEGPSVKEHSVWNISFYMGAKDIDVLLPVDERLEKALDYYGWFAPISKGLLKILKWLYIYLKNYGLAIIVLTFLMKLLLFPLSIHGEKNMKEQREMQKKLAYIQQRYKDDPTRLAQERAELIKRYGVPGLGGCLPMLLQIPIFFALSKLLGNAIELYQVPFLWVPDLSAKDPYYIFPVLVCLGMLTNAAAVDAKQRMSIVAMALVFGAFTASLSAGLALYIIVNSLLSFMQSSILKLIHK